VTSSSSRGLAVLIPFLLLLAAGCGGGLELKRVNSAQDKPNNVWVFFTVKDGKDGVGGLQAEDFTIYEDDKEVSKFESKQVILNPEVAAVMYTMLLVDMSGSISDSGEADRLVDAAKSFSDRVGKSQKVGVYAFDGSPELHSVTPFTESKGSVEGGLEGLRKWKPKDPSTNLRGAVVEGLRTLKTELDKEKKPLKFGTLVVFTDGTDQAGRVSHEDMMKEIGDDKYEFYEIYAIGVGAEMAESELKDIGRDGMELATDNAKIQEAFDKIAERIENATRSFYLLSYCTPARAGEHEVRIKADYKRDDANKSGRLEYKFDAKGFGPPPDCDPNKKPRFDLKSPDLDSEDGGDADATAKGKVEVKGNLNAQ
jgi:von Willebrand factor type A domain